MPSRAIDDDTPDGTALRDSIRMVVIGDGRYMPPQRPSESGAFVRPGVLKTGDLACLSCSAARPFPHAENSWVQALFRAQARTTDIGDHHGHR
jgi:hypothetical protein